MQLMKVAIWVIVILLLLTVGAVIALSSVYNDLLEPVNPEATDDYTLVDIPQGANAESIGELLFNKGLIHNQLAFRIYVRQHNRQAGLKGYNLFP